MEVSICPRLMNKYYLRYQQVKTFYYSMQCGNVFMLSTDQYSNQSIFNINSHLSESFSYQHSQCQGD